MYAWNHGDLGSLLPELLGAGHAATDMVTIQKDSGHV